VKATKGENINKRTAEEGEKERTRRKCEWQRERYNNKMKQVGEKERGKKDENSNSPVDSLHDTSNSKQELESRVTVW